MKKMIALILFLVIFDQIVKMIVKINIPFESQIYIIPNFFYLTNVENFGAAFSMFQGSRLFLILLAFLALYFLKKYFLYNIESTFQKLAYSFLIGGIIANLIDRVFYGKVVDYLGIWIFNYAFPIFNFADICIVLGALMVVMSMLRGDLVGNNK